MRFWLGALRRSGSILVAVAGVAGVEVSLLDSSINGVENKSVKAVLVEVLLNGKDPGLRNGVSDGPRFVTDQFLGFRGLFSTLGHCIRIFLEDLGSDLGRKELCHEGHAHLVENVLVDGLFSFVALLGGVVAWWRSVRQG